MSLSYSAITNRGKVTLPSVDIWGTNNNIIKDPPKSIHLRRIDKVGENMDIVKMIDNSDRHSEAIMRFSRGINPSVSVSYSNNTSGIQAKLPYSINKDGDFHPPVLAPQDLLPLSRLPRNSTFVITNPTMPDTSKQLNNARNVNTTRAVKHDIISAHVRPTLTYNLQKPIQEAYDVSYNIQPVLLKSCSTQKISSDRTVQNVIKPTKVIIDNNITAFAYSNKSTPNIFNNPINNGFLDTERFLQNPLNTSASSNQNNSNNNIDQRDTLFNLRNGLTRDDIRNSNVVSSKQGIGEKVSYIHEDLELMKNLPNYSSRSNNKGYEQENYIHDDIHLERNLPEYETRTNRTDISKTTFIHEDLELSRTLPEYNAFSNKSTKENYVSFLNDEIELERNLPVYESRSNRRGHENITYIHNDIELLRSIPQHQVKTNRTQSTDKYHQPEHIPILQRKSVLGQRDVNESRKGETNLSSTKYNLQEKINAGGFSNSGNIPSFERNFQVNENYETDRSKMNRLINKQFEGRYGPTVYS